MTEQPENTEEPEQSEAAEQTAPEAPAETLPPDERRRRDRARAEARPPRTPSERQAERLEERRRKAARRRAYRARAKTRRAERRAAAAPAEEAPPLHPEVPKGNRKVRQGVVVSDKADKSITVRIDMARRHRLYGKVVRSSGTLHAHDERNEAGVGDTVRVVESRPLSRTKRWRLAEVLERAR
jgi:small subunit ribosomal protein S17